MFEQNIWRTAKAPFALFYCVNACMHIDYMLPLLVLTAFSYREPHFGEQHDGHIAPNFCLADSASSLWYKMRVQLPGRIADIIKKVQAPVLPTQQNWDL